MLRPILATLGAAALSLTFLAAPPPASAAVVHRVLFDDTKAETAGNADWIISTAMPDPTVQNPNPTGETSWTGALSAWGVAAGGSTLGTFSDLNHSAGYVQRSFPVSLPAGGTVTVSFTGVEGTKLQTSLVVDDVALTV